MTQESGFGSSDTNTTFSSFHNTNDEDEKAIAEEKAAEEKKVASVAKGKATRAKNVRAKARVEAKAEKESPVPGHGGVVSVRDGVTTIRCGECGATVSGDVAKELEKSMATHHKESGHK